MKIEIEFGCQSGDATVFLDRSRDGETVSLSAGQTYTMVLADIEVETRDGDLSWEDVKAAVKRSTQAAWKTPGIGAAGRPNGRVSARPVSSDLMIRQYKDVDAFLSSDDKDHEDHLVKKGQTFTVDMIGSNVITLMPVPPQ